VVFIASRYIGVRGEMVNGVETHGRKQGVKPRTIEHVEFVKMEPVARKKVLDLLLFSQVQVVDAPDLVAALDQSVAKVTADETGSAGDEISHG
jgi:hypothetical protein